jgi:hypothetical protein
MSQVSDKPVSTLKKEAPGDLPVMLKQPTFIYSQFDWACSEKRLDNALYLQI